MAIQQTNAGLVEELPPYIKSEEVAELAEQVISEHTGFRDLEELEICYLQRTDQPLDPEDEIDQIIAVVKASAPWQAASGVDVIIWVKKANWDLWNEKLKRALLTHALSHLMVTEDGKLKKLGHDVEAFVREANEFGAWHPELSKLARSLADGPKATKVTISAGGRTVETDSDALEAAARDPGKITDLRNAARRAREGSDA